MLSHINSNRLLGGVAFLVATGALFSLARPQRADVAPEQSVPRAARMYFESSADKSQTYFARGSDYALTLTADGATLGVRNGDARAELALSFANSNPFVSLRPAGSSAPVAHYYVGGNPLAWRRNVALHEQVVYRALYKGIDAVFYGNGRLFEYDFVVAPHADPGQVTLRFAQHERLYLEQSGDLILVTRAGPIRQRHPVAYQTIAGQRQHVAASYWLASDGGVRIRIGDYDPDQPLIIDPALDFSTYFGGSAIDVGTRVAVDGNGNSYVVGYTFSPDVRPDNSFGDNATVGTGLNSNVFVSKYTADGALAYVAIIGGSSVDYGRDIAVNANGVVHITGETQSADFPVTGSAPLPFGGAYDAFVAMLSSDGSKLIYSGLLGGGAADFGHGLALNADGDVYVAGETWSVDFPVTAETAFSIECGGCGTDTYDGFLAVLDAKDHALTYSTYFGGSGNDKIHAVAVDPSTGVAYLAGETLSSDLPVLNAAQTDIAGKVDVVVAALNPTVAGTNGLLYASYLGGGDDDTAERIAVNGDGHVYVAGVTASDDFPRKNAYQTLLRGDSDAFVAKFNPSASSGSSLLFSTYFGGTGEESADGIAVDATGAPVIAGMTTSDNLPTVLPIQDRLAGGTDGFIATLSVGGNSLQYSTYVGASGVDALGGIAVAPNRLLVAAGDSTSGDFAIAGGAAQHTFAGVTDAILVRVDSSADASPAPAGATGATDKKAAGGGTLDALWLLAFAFAPFRRYRAGA
jgi:hypothetical protein